jgi:hypothetical protein
VSRSDFEKSGFENSFECYPLMLPDTYVGRINMKRMDAGPRERLLSTTLAWPEIQVNHLFNKDDL